MRTELERTVRVAAIAKINDAFRRCACRGHLPRKAGRFVMTATLSHLGAAGMVEVLRKVGGFDAFEAGNDPYQEHDFGKVKVLGEEVVWKIDYYADAACEYGAEDPLNAYRVMTVMPASDY